MERCITTIITTEETMNDSIDDVFSAIDNQNVDGFVECLTPNATLRFGNQPPQTGRQAIAESIGGFFSMIEDLNHDRRQVFEVDGAVVVEGSVEYLRKDGDTVEVPFCNVMYLNDAGEQIRRYNIYVDQGPLFD